MYITCEQCNTIFRLDEKRLKATGSKVRCSVCNNVFMARPPIAEDSRRDGPADMHAATAQAVEHAEPREAEKTFDQELQGIDLAELDSILEQDRSEEISPLGDARRDRPGDVTVDEAGEFDETDLDMDFESALALDEEPSKSVVAETSEEEGEAHDLDMDFELVAPEPDGDQKALEEGQSFQDDLEMDFELESEADQQGDTEKQGEEIDLEQDGLGEDLEKVLDDFEDALDKPEHTGNEISVAEEAIDDDLSLDIDLDLEEEPTALETEDQEPELSLDEGVEQALSEAPGTEPSDVMTADASDQDEEFDLAGLDNLLDEVQQDQASESEEEIDLSVDELLELEDDEILVTELEEGKDQAISAVTPEQEDDELDLSGFDAILDENQEAEKPGPEELELSLDDEAAEVLPETGKEEGAAISAVTPEQEDDELDLSGFDVIQDEDHETERPEPEEIELSLDEGDESATSEEAAFEPEKDLDAAADTEQGDEMDLSGLDTLLDEVDDKAGESEPEDLELSLDDEGELAPIEEADLEMAADKKADDDLGELEELEFELDAEFEDKPVSKGEKEELPEEKAEEDGEIDLSDIEKMLEDDTLVPEPGPETEDLDLDLTGRSGKLDQDAGDDLAAGSSGEIDLAEIEAAIDSADDDIDTSMDEEQELELDLEPLDEGMEKQSEEPELVLEMEDDKASAKDTGTDDTVEIDLSDLDLSVEEEKPEVESEIINAGDIELEFQLEDEGATATIESPETFAPGQITSEAEEATLVADSEDVLIKEAFAEPPAIEKEIEKKIKKAAPVTKKKKGTSKALVVVLIIVLLGGGGYFGYDYITKNNIQLPYISDAVNYINDFINPKPQDPTGTAQLSTLDINSKFIENETAGRIFVVTGKVRNGYTVPRKMIRLQGKLYTKGKVLAKTELTIAGNVVNDLELANQDVVQIKQRLKAAGGQTAQVVANPGQTLPFIVVFSDLPPDLDEFAIEMSSSSLAQ